MPNGVKIALVWVGLMLAALFVSFEVLDLDQTEPGSGAGFIVLCFLLAAAGLAILITRLIRQGGQRES